VIGVARSLDLALGAGRWAAWVGFALVIGLLVAGDPRGVGDSAPLAARLRTMWLVAALLSVAGALATLLLEPVSAARGDWSDAVDAGLLSGAFDAGGNGWAIVVRLVMVACAVLLGLRALARPDMVASAGWANSAAMSVVVGAVAAALDGHAAETDGGAVVAVAVGAAHLTAVGAWFGGIVVLVFLGAGGHDIDAVTERFSRIAGWLVPVAVVSGPVLAWMVIGDVTAVGDDAYSRWLIVKVFLVVAVLAVAAATRLASRSGNRRATVRGMVAELVVASAILSVVSGLAALDPTEAASQVQVVRRLVSEDTIAVVEITDARVGRTVVHVYFTPPGGSLDTVAGAAATLTAAGSGASTGEQLVLDLVPSGANHYTSVVELPSPGTWTLELTASPGTTEEIVFTGSFDVAGD